MKHIFSLTPIFMFILISCEKEIDLDLEDKSGQIVIEANVSDKEEFHTARITRSQAFNQPTKVDGISNAFVTISDNFGMIDTLAYISDGNYRTQNLGAGISGRTYTLEVVIEGKKYTSLSTMPSKVPLTGLRLDSMSIFGNSNYNVVPEYVDPPTLGNCYLFFVTIENKNGLVLEANNDNFGNGVANQRNLDLPFDENNPVKSGDNVIVEMRTIDKSIYTYFTALSQLAENGPGGGITPANPPSNISGGALGYFSAHTSQSLSIMVR